MTQAIGRTYRERMKRTAKSIVRRRFSGLMPAPAGRWPRSGPVELTLFGFQSVSPADIELWIATIAPRISRAKYARYAQEYNVAGKVAAAKARGDWPPRAP